MTHVPVLLDEAVEALAPRRDGWYLDATFGRGGHTAAILEHLGPAGRLYAMDRDGEAAGAALQRFGDDGRFKFCRDSFAGMAEFLSSQGVMGSLSGVLMDLGVSSPQLDHPRRGFSFRADGPLDMRMDTSVGITAAQWLAQADERRIAQVLFEYGEERYARRIARAIVAARADAPIETTRQLAELIGQAVPRREHNKDPATRAFQALRIEINNELNELQQGLASALEALALGGRLVVISFHSLEDRLVKHFMRGHAREKPVFTRSGELLPMVGGALRLKLIGKPIRPSAIEIKGNPRARSAVLRVAEKLA
ncbi:MAG: 16S rRNA (cytosine(1402)-N(4))-methyltransferase RsmH [Thiotrichales bacterium]